MCIFCHGFLDNADLFSFNVHVCYLKKKSLLENRRFSCFGSRLNRDTLLMERICSSESKFFHVREDSIVPGLCITRSKQEAT